MLEFSTTMLHAPSPYQRCSFFGTQFSLE